MPATTKQITTAGGSTVIAGQSALLKGVSVTAASAAATVTLYDNASASSGSVLETITVPANSTQWVDYSDSVVCNNGITATVTGTGAVAQIRYELSA